MSSNPSHILTPIPNGASVYQALRLIVAHDPFAEAYAKAVLKAFGAATPETVQDQARKLLQLWDSLMPAPTIANPAYNQAIIDETRAMVRN